MYLLQGKHSQIKIDLYLYSMLKKFTPVITGPREDSKIAMKEVVHIAMGPLFPQP